MGFVDDVCLQVLTEVSTSTMVADPGPVGFESLQDRPISNQKLVPGTWVNKGKKKRKGGAS